MPSQPPQYVDHFWGERNQGFEVLQQSVKHATRSTGELLDLLREICALQDASYKTLTKLARQVNSYTNTSSSSFGAFTPCWDYVKTLLETQATLHLALHQHWSELMKDVQKYAEEHTRKVKDMKEADAHVQEVVNSFHSANFQLQKSRDIYKQRCSELLFLKFRLSENGVTPRDVEKAQGRLQKATNEYKYLVERYNNLRTSYIEMMRSACMRYQELETVHLEKMRNFISLFCTAWNGYLNSGAQPLQQLQQALTQKLSVRSLLRRFLEKRSTGSQLPVEAVFEKVDLDNGTPVVPERSTSVGGSRRLSGHVATPAPVAALSSAERRASEGDFLKLDSDQDNSAGHSMKNRALFGGLMRSKKYSPKGAARLSTATPPPTSQPTPKKEIDLLDCEPTVPPLVQVDEQGYSIPPVDIWKRSDLDSLNNTSSSSDEEEKETKKLRKLVIKPLGSSTSALDTLDLDAGTETPVDLRMPSSSKGATLTRMSLALPQPPGPSGGGRMSKGRISLGGMKQHPSNMNRQRCKSVMDIITCPSEEEEDELELEGKSKKTVWELDPSHQSAQEPPVNVRLSSGKEVSGGLLSSGGLAGPASRSGRFMRQSSSPQAPSPGNTSTGSGNRESPVRMSKVTDPWNETEETTSSGSPGSLPPVPESKEMTLFHEKQMSSPPASPVRAPVPPRRPALPPPPYSRSNSTADIIPVIPVAVATTETHHVRFGESSRVLECRVEGELRVAFPVGAQSVFSIPTSATASTPLPEFRFHMQQVKLLRLNPKFFTSSDCQSTSSELQLRPQMEQVRSYVLSHIQQGPQRSHVTVDLLRYQVPTLAPPVLMDCIWQPVVLDGEHCSALQLTVECRVAHPHLVPLEMRVFCPLPCSIDEANSAQNLLQVDSSPKADVQSNEGRVEWLLAMRAETDLTPDMAQSQFAYSIKATFKSKTNLTPQQIHVKFALANLGDGSLRFELNQPSTYRVTFHKRRVVSGQYLWQPQVQAT